MPDESEKKLAITVYESESGPVQLTLDAEHQTVWATQAEIASIFGVERSVVTKHIGNIFTSGELDEKSNVQKMHIAFSDRPIANYSLDVVISVGYRVNSKMATRFRQWATDTLKRYLTDGYVINAGRLAANPDAMRQLAAEIRSVRLSEQATYAKVRDIFKLSASDYDSNSRAVKNFFAQAQDKFHFAVTQKTSAQIVLERADAKKPNMGLRTMAGDAPTATDVVIGKNYLDEDELHFLENISEQFLLFCETQAMRGKKMTMEELQFRLNTILAANDYPVLYEYPGAVRKQAEKHAHDELKKFKSLGEPPARRRLTPIRPPA